MKQYCIYLRVSTTRQFSSGLGIEAQRETCLNYIKSQDGELLKEFIDSESGKNRNRPGLLSAIDFCKTNGCALVIAKLDRLARDVEFTFKVINTGIDIHFCDMPMINTMILGVFASVAQYERELISGRTKAALTAKRERGEVWNKEISTERINKAVEASAKSRREKARNNPKNVFFWQFCLNWQKKNGKFTAMTDFQPIADELNSLGQTTVKGLPFTKNRVRAAYQNLSNFMI